jgi:HD-like signal output (HDOD) protein
MPLALHRLLSVFQDESASIRKIEGMLQLDQSLCSKILRIANSSYYGFRGKITSLSRAMLVIGFDEVKVICFSLLLLELLSDKKILTAGQRERFWKKALVVAKIAAMMAGRRPWIGEEEAYCLGLLHDLGEVVMAVHLKDHYRRLQELARANDVPLWRAESLYGLGHGLVGRWLAVKWGLPEVFVRVLEFHHEPEAAPSFKAEVKMIHLANVLSDSREGPEMLKDAPTLEYCHDLCVSEEEWEEYEEQLPLIRAEVDQLWDLMK